jgi:hypothetical protein
MQPISSISVWVLLEDAEFALLELNVLELLPLSEFEPEDSMAVESETL